MVISDHAGVREERQDFYNGRGFGTTDNESVFDLMHVASKMACELNHGHKRAGLDFLIWDFEALSLIYTWSTRGTISGEGEMNYLFN